MKTASAIIASLGGSAVVAKGTGFPLTTVNSWKDSNFIPEWRRPALLKLAQDANTPLSTADFPPIEQRISRKQAAA